VSDLPANIYAHKIADGTVSNTEYQHLNGVTSPIQTQLNAKPDLTDTNAWTGENSFTKFKLNAEVSHSVTSTAGYSCLDKNVIILTPSANGYTASLTNLSPNRPIFVINGSGTYSVTVNAAIPTLLAANGCAWILYNSTKGTTYCIGD
jgi:hypothetical protein